MPGMMFGKGVRTRPLLEGEGAYFPRGRPGRRVAETLVSVRAWRYMFSTAAADCYVVAEIRFESQNTADVAAFK
jgi:hypothetical protein